MVVVRRALLLTQETRLDEGDVRELTRSGVHEELSDTASHTGVLASPKGEEWNVAEVVASVETGRGDPIPDRWQRAQLERVLEPVRLGRVLVNAIGEGPCHLCGKVSIADGPLRGGAGKERQVVLDVEADRKLIVVASP